ncbi:hypothetical protein [Peptoniphilus mikwangii]|uniref:hypothetical protein n=1 Tax=Peptoniphilus mikwangii TaxID=1354300 RepID=UPI001F161BCA|nr:hypothetical protein [Peptoniphilus mikwangii]
MKDTSYVELIRFTDSTMTTINDKSKLRDILIEIDSLSGEKTTEFTEYASPPNFINIYDKNFKKTELAKTGYFIKINGQWYKLDQKSVDRFDRVFEKYNKNPSE